VLGMLSGRVAFEMLMFSSSFLTPSSLILVYGSCCFFFFTSDLYLIYCIPMKVIRLDIFLRIHVTSGVYLEI
jgi:hypothetical protein